ncbi:hypothetical protein [Bdellovibrio sp. HCB337]|uniref:hypothetical protein n=1 Tax=Bdellovibrio sp. HCB337 TaxID=3394358 RepID=UPI0039A43131
MKEFVLVLVFLLSTTAFAQNSIQGQLIERREHIRNWVTLCKEAPFEGTFSSQHSHCDHGDLMIFSGLSCLAATLAGDAVTAEARCRDVELSQGSNGRWWRGPKFVDQPFEGSSFSRDQFRGIVAYAIAYGLRSRDPVEKNTVKKSFLAWLKYVEQEDNNNMCDDGKGYFSSCHMRPGTLNMIYLILKSLEIDNEAKRMLGEDSKLWKKIYNERDEHKNFFNDIEVLFTEKGYPLHLKATTVLFHRLLGYYQYSERAKTRIRRTVKTLEKKDPDNALFTFLDVGARPDVIQKVLSRCPANPPPYDNGSGDWQWQRDAEDQAWRRSNGWDCIYMINLLIAHQNKKLTWVW